MPSLELAKRWHLAIFYSTRAFFNPHNHRCFHRYPIPSGHSPIPLAGGVPPRCKGTMPSWCVATSSNRCASSEEGLGAWRLQKFDADIKGYSTLIWLYSRYIDIYIYISWLIWFYSRYIMIYHDISWYIMIYHDISELSIVYEAYITF